MAVHSLSGLKLDFLDPAKRGTGRKVYAHSYSSSSAPKRSALASPMVVADIKEFVAYAARDPEVISSRAQLRDYERRHGVKQCGFDQGDIIAETDAHYGKIREKAQGIKGGWLGND